VLLYLDSIARDCAGLRFQISREISAKRISPPPGKSRKARRAAA